MARHGVRCEVRKQRYPGRRDAHRADTEVFVQFFKVLGMRLLGMRVVVWNDSKCSLFMTFL